MSSLRFDHTRDRRLSYVHWSQIVEIKICLSLFSHHLLSSLHVHSVNVSILVNRKRNKNLVTSLKELRASII